jgi:hypothetical protein
MSKPSPANAGLPDWPVELLRVVEPQEAERLSSLSWDTIKRRYPDKIIELSEHRKGMRVGDALTLKRT